MAETIREGCEDFTSGRPFRVNAKDLTLPWNGRGRRAFTCGLCLKQFEEGDVIRWVWCHAAPNSFVHEGCDSPDVEARLIDFWHNTIQPILAKWGDS